MKKSFLLLLLFFGCLFIIFPGTMIAQDTTAVQPQKAPKKKSSADKVFFGGRLGISFGNYTMIAVYPMVGYKFTPKLSGGVELGYEYISDKRYSTTFNTSNYGGSLFARYRVVPPAFIHVEYAMYNYELYYSDLTSSREWVPFLFVGAGYIQRLGPRTSLFAMVKFDVLQDNNSPYNDWEPWISVGVHAGF